MGDITEFAVWLSSSPESANIHRPVREILLPRQVWPSAAAACPAIHGSLVGNRTILGSGVSHSEDDPIGPADLVSSFAE